MQAPPERLGSFYLGAEYDLSAGEVTGIPVNYDARDLVTHAVCVGMTGSGKTGLCVGLLEEAGMDRVPAILIDPKGDITNLLLQFPDLQPADFLEWINADDARRKEKTPEEFAGSTAELWRNGLADWGIDGERIKTLLETVDYTIFTPGSDAGVPINILGSLAAPGLDFETNAEAIRERISGTVAALLGLVNVDSDPLQGREAILLSNIFEHFWKQNEDLDLAKLIMSIQDPPVRQVGVFDVDTFFPQKDRFSLAMSFNNLMAAPAFQNWLQGEPLDVDTLFFTADGRPRHSIFYIAHLSDSERMFFMTLLLENVVTWMRRQSGTTSLRALLYIDEIFGFFPPTAEPPSKRPLLTLLKQARAFGLGVVLVTQNPVDLDYKGLTNAGTWFIGKLQAERDKDRVLSGLKGALAEAGNTGGADLDTLISQLGSRVFLLHNVHGDGPVVMHTRWVHSYLRGPLTRPQVRMLMASRAVEEAVVETAAAPPAPTETSSSTAPLPAQTPPPAPAAHEPEIPEGYMDTAPGLDPKVQQVYLPVQLDENRAMRILEEQGARLQQVQEIFLTYEAAVIGMANVNFLDRKRKIEVKTEQNRLVTHMDRFGVDWEHAQTVALEERELGRAPDRVDPGQGPLYLPVPEAVNDSAKLKAADRDLSDWLYYNVRYPITVHETLDLFQEPDESERSFKIRLQQAAREERDAAVDKLQAKHEKELDRLEQKLQKEERELAEDKAEWEGRRAEELVNIGESVLSYFVGRRRSFSSAMTKRRMTSKAYMDIEESEEEIEDLKEEIEDLNARLQAETEEITVHYADLMDELSTDELKPRRTDVDIELVALAWLPSWLIRFDDGLRVREATVPAFEQAEQP